MLEKVAQVQVDKETNQPGWIATKVDEDGNIIIDNNNHANEWLLMIRLLKRNMK